jgi:ketosteroid isomerase-like protein
MKNRCAISVMVLALLVIISQPAKADDFADLKAANEKYFNAWNTADVETFSNFWIDGGVWFSDSRAFPLTVTQSQARKAYWVKWFETHSIRFTWYNPQFLVAGTTGLVWGHITQTKGGLHEEAFCSFGLRNGFVWNESCLCTRQMHGVRGGRVFRGFKHLRMFA